MIKGELDLERALRDPAYLDTVLRMLMPADRRRLAAAEGRCIAARQRRSLAALDAAAGRPAPGVLSLASARALG